MHALNVIDYETQNKNCIEDKAYNSLLKNKITYAAAQAIQPLTPDIKLTVRHEAKL